MEFTTTEIMTIAKSFADSGMFPDCKSMAQAAVKIQAGREFGIQPFAAMSGIHIIQGKPTIGAGLMAARVKGFGKYDYKVIEHNDKVCSIEFYQLSKQNMNVKELLGTSTFTIDDAKKAGTKNLDKFPRNMLFSRAISNGVKWFTPDIYEMPVYVPEEMVQVTEDVQAVEVKAETPKQRTLNDEQFQAMMAKIHAGEFLKDGVTLVKDWALDNVTLTLEQAAQFTVSPTSGTIQASDALSVNNDFII